MKKQMLLVMGVLLAVTLACNLMSPKLATPTALTRATQVSPEEPGDRDATATMKATERPTATIAPSATPEEPTATPTATEVPQPALPVVLADRSIEPAQLSVVDPASLSVQKSFTASSMGEIYNVIAAADAVFYLDSTNTKIRWAGFDGSSGELAFINPGGGFFQGRILPSPDGKRIAWTLVTDQTGESNHNMLKIANKDGSGGVVLVDEVSTPPVAWTPINWSEDGQWLYYASIPYGIGGYILFSGILDVRRVPVQGGGVEVILPELSLMGDAVISPDDSTLAYIRSAYGQNPDEMIMELVLQDINSGNSRAMKLPAGYLQVGAITWSPDSQSLALALAVGNWDIEAYTVLRVEAQTLTSQTLLDMDKRLLQPVIWPVADSLWLKDFIGDAMVLDLTLGTLTQTAGSQSVLSTEYR